MGIIKKYNELIKTNRKLKNNWLNGQLFMFIDSNKFILVIATGINSYYRHVFMKFYLVVVMILMIVVDDNQYLPPSPLLYY